MEAIDWCENLSPTWFANASYDDTDPEEFIQRLCDLCADRIVQDTAILMKYVLVNGCEVPARLKNDMIDAATRHYQSLSLVTMLNFWGYRSYKFSMPAFCKDWRLFFLTIQGRPFFNSLLDRNLKFLKSVFRCAVDFQYSEQTANNSLKYLDFGELPMPLHDILTMRDHFATGGRSGACVPCGDQDGLTVAVNCIAMDEEGVRKLRKEIEAAEGKPWPYRLIVTGFHFLPSDLKLFDLEKLLLPSAERVERFSIDFSQIPDTPKILTTYCHLKSFNLSFGLGEIGPNVAPIADALGELFQLEQLVFYNVILTGLLKKLLHKLGSDRLEYLCLAHCQLAKRDLLYLGDAHFAKNLKNLDLSGNVLDSRGLKAVVSACTDLRVLEIGFCEYRGEDDCDIFAVLSELRQLHLLNMHFFKNLDHQDVLLNAGNIRKMSNLRFFRVQHSKNEAYNISGDNDYEEVHFEFPYDMESALKRMTWENLAGIFLAVVFDGGLHSKTTVWHPMPSPVVRAVWKEDG